MTESINITELLATWSNGKTEALDRLLPLVEAELRRIAHNYMRRENVNHTLQTTALVNEAFLQLINQKAVQWQNRAHFFALSSKIMRRILLNHARNRVANKRGGGAEHISFENTVVLSLEKSAEIIALDEALERLAKIDKTKSRIVEMRFFGGLTVEEAAEAIGVSPVTVAVHWRLGEGVARARDSQRKFYRIVFACFSFVSYSLLGLYSVNLQAGFVIQLSV